MIHVSPSNPICTVVYPRRELPHSHRHIIYKPRTYGYQGFSAIMAFQPSRHESYYGFTVNLQSVWFYNQYGLTAITVLLSTWVIRFTAMVIFQPSYSYYCTITIEALQPWFLVLIPGEAILLYLTKTKNQIRWHWCTRIILLCIRYATLGLVGYVGPHLPFQSRLTVERPYNIHATRAM